MTSSRLASHWINLKPSLNKWSERIRHLRSKSSFSFTLLLRFIVVWTVKLGLQTPPTTFPEACESTLKFP